MSNPISLPHKNEVDALKALVAEARDLMLAVGESDDVPIQLRQHSWLLEANTLVPIKWQLLQGED